MAIYCSILAWEIPWTEEPSRLHGVTKSQTWLSDYTTTTTNMALSKKNVVAEKVMMLCKFLMKFYIFYY